MLERGARIGLAGWSYPDWKGTVYPQPAPRGFSPLRFIAQRFDCIEINRTFYRNITAPTAQRWLDEVADLPHFSFTAKAPGALTHDRDARDAELRARAEIFAEGIAPLANAGRLGGVLLQFPWFFADCSESRHRLTVLAEALDEFALFVELRHTSFLSASSGGGLSFLEQNSLHYTNIDMPSSRTAPSMTSINTGSLGYFRLHGRNTKAWFDRQATRDDKYDYLYSESELRQLVVLVDQLAARTATTYVITNNHFRGQAVTNAEQLAVLMGKPLPRPAPAGAGGDVQTEFPF